MNIDKYFPALHSSGLRAPPVRVWILLSPALVPACAEPKATCGGHSKFRAVEHRQNWQKQYPSPARDCYLGLSPASPQNPSRSAKIRDCHAWRALRKLDATPEGLAESLACLPWRPGVSAPLPCYYFCKARLGVSPHPPPHSHRPGITPEFSHLDVQGSWRVAAPKTPAVPPGLAPRGALHWGDEDGVAHRARGTESSGRGQPPRTPAQQRS